MASDEKNWEMDCDDFKCIEDPVVGELGGGAQSIVRLTLHTTLGPVAVKCFSVTGGAPDRRRLERKIARELQIMQNAANNMSIVQTHGWVKWHKAMGLVMEYLPVGSIRQFTVDSFAKLTPKVILRMAHEIASAIVYMHNPLGDHRVVHGDLKPENILLTKDLHCKVGDFGSAELAALTGATSEPGPKREKLNMTLAYAAPEKLKKPNIKPKKEQDTYSFGMLLYVLLTGSTPYAYFYQESRFIESIIRGERPDTEEIDALKEAASTEDKQIIEVLESIMRKCWQQDPSDRPDMISVGDQLQVLRDQQNDAAVLMEVEQVLKTMTLSPPIAQEQRLVPLREFSPINGEFAREGIVYNIYNLPIVQQAAINCDVVEFEQDARCKMHGNYKPGKSPERKPTLSEVFESLGQTWLPSNVRPALDFLEKYKVSLKNQKYEEAKTMTTKITSMIEDNIDATAKDVKEFGRKLREKKLFLESIAIFDAASAMFEKMGKTEENLEWMRFCVGEMRDTNIAMIGDDASMKVTVKNFVIPLMREKLRHIEDTSLVSEQFKCLQVCQVLFYIEYSEYSVDEWEEREKTLRFALTRMKDVFRADVLKFQVYGHLLNNLGTVCSLTSRFEEAASFFKQAIDAWKTATDYSDEDGRKKDIVWSENNLKVVQHKMK